jgi:hypothetical protein
MRRSGRRQGEPAVARDHRRDPVPARWRDVGIPEHLGVIVGVRIDEPRAEDQAGEIDLVVVEPEIGADADNAPTLDRHVHPLGWRAGSVHHLRPTQDHGTGRLCMLLPVLQSGLLTSCHTGLPPHDGSPRPGRLHHHTRAHQLCMHD